MATNTAAGRSQTEASEAQGTSTGGPRQAAEGVAAGIAGAAETVGARLPEAAATTRAAVDEAARRMATGSDEMLTVATAFSLGAALGMLVGGASRILVTLALIPAAAMSMTLFDRGSLGGRRRTGG